LCPLIYLDSSNCNGQTLRVLYINAYWVTPYDNHYSDTIQACVAGTVVFNKFTSYLNTYDSFKNKSKPRIISCTENNKMIMQLAKPTLAGREKHFSNK
jgi:hypothetical protein